MFVLYTIDLFPGIEYLMPWRTVLEVAKGIQARGNDVVVLNGCHSNDMIYDYSWQGVNIVGIQVGMDSLRERIDGMKVDVLYIPVTWRAGLKNISALKSIPCNKVAYLSGGVYDLCGSMLLLMNSSFNTAKPYLIESLVPKDILGSKLRDAGFGATIGLTELSTKMAVKAGLPNPICIHPGKDSFEEIIPDNSALESFQLVGKKWLLFTGSPAPIRGASVLIKAIDRANNDDITLVMLIRGDKGADLENVVRTQKNMKHPNRVIVINEKLSREQLRAFFGAAWYAVLPFLTVPSEVPLTYFELLSCGTPIVSFPNGGTTEYLYSSLVLAKRTINGMAAVLDEVWNNTDLRKQRSDAGLEIMAAHSTWEDVSKNWEGIVKK